MSNCRTTSILGRSPVSRGSLNLVILDFLKEMEGKEGGFKECGEFTLKDTSFKVVVYPNGRKGYKVGYVCVVLESKSEQEVVVDFIKATVNVRVGEKHGKTMSALYAGGWYLSHEMCKNSLKDGVLEVSVEVEIAGDVIMISTENKSRDHWVNENLYNDMSRADFFLDCEGEKIFCHRIVLAAASYFKGLENFEESKQGSIKFPFSPEVSKSFIRFVYIGKIEERVLDDNIVTMLRLADFLGVEQLMKRVEGRMVELLSKECMVNYFVMGDTYHGQTIREAAKTFIKAKLGWLKEKEDWKEMFGNRLELIIEVLE